VAVSESRVSTKLGHDIIVMGASAGGLQAIQQIVRRLPSDLPAAVFVVIHTGPDTPGILPRILSRNGGLAAAHVRDAEEIKAGRIYCAPPDHHLLIEPRVVRAFHGPKENGFRPAIDPLFRTAAAAYSTRVVGVVLSGALDDGVHGLMRIKQRGGVTIVQNPEEAVVDALPLAAIKYVDVDHIAGSDEIAKLLVELPLRASRNGEPPMAENEPIKATIASGVNNILNSHKEGSAPSAFTCPECGGSLWEMKDGKMSRFRCHVGHVYSNDSLVIQKDGALENALWTALRALEESAALRYRMAQRAAEGKMSVIAEGFERRAREDETRAALLREFLLPEEETATVTSKKGAKPRSVKRKRTAKRAK
jgi:two-component system chemotaxis response regulator CheB